MNLKEFKSFIPMKDTYALIGSNISHSVSPELHTLMFSLKDIDADYIIIDIDISEFEQAINLAKNKLCGFNLTIPFKKLIQPFLSNHNNLTSINTVRVSDMTGFNTDILGFADTINICNVSLKEKKVLILGSGGLSTIMANFCVKNKADVSIASRYPKNVKNKIYNVKYIPYYIKDDFDIVLNGTPIGMYPYETASPLQYIPANCSFVFDGIYNPPKTKLIKKAIYNKMKCSNGLYMLVMQAVYAHKIWFKSDFDDIQIRSLTRKTLGAIASKRLTKNIILCGFMGSGKTSIGKIIHKLTGLEVVDTDKLIESTINMSIKEYFEKYDERSFRTLEHQIIKEVCQRKNIIISTGGGALTYDKNIATLKNSGILFHINAPLSNILRNTKDNDKRPLLNGNYSDIKKLYDTRFKLYKTHCNFSLYGNNIHEIALNILENI